MKFNPGHDMPYATFGETLLARADDDHTALLFEDSSWTWREFVAESAVRSALMIDWQDTLRSRIDERPERYRSVHVGILLENVPEYLWLLCGAAFAGVTVVGINPTRRGDELATDIRSVDCDVIVTDTDGLALLEGLDTGVADVHVTDSPEWRALLDANAGAPAELTEAAADPETLLALLFTSGSTGAPKAVMCGTGRMAMLGAVNWRNLVRDDVAYCAMPLFHGNALFASFSPTVFVGCTFAMRRKFSASGFLPDVLKFGATYMNYVGRSLSYILAQPEVPEEQNTRLRTVFGTEASVHDRVEFARRFGVEPGESFGCSEGAVVIARTEDTPPDALGVPGAFINLRILDEGGQECVPATFDSTGKLANADEAIGEMVNLTGASMFEGYYRNETATAERIDGEAYRSGDLGYRDEQGFFYFAGRSGDRIRVDSENFSAGPVERILDRFPGVLVVAVYPVPDSVTGDQVMSTIQMEPTAEFDPVAFGEFCDTSADLGSKWAPRFVRIVEEMPVTATRKLAKPVLRRESWCSEGATVYFREGTSGPYRLLNDEDRARLLALYETHHRSPAGV